MDKSIYRELLASIGMLRAAQAILECQISNISTHSMKLALKHINKAIEDLEEDTNGG